MRWFFPPWGGPDTHEARAVTRQSKDCKIAEMTEAAFDPKTSLIDLFGAGKTREQHIPIVDGLVNNNTYFAQVNVRNDGALPGIPDDVAVEVPAVVDIKGIQPLRVDPLPQKLMLTYMLPVWLRMEQRLHAYLHRDRSVLLYRVLDNHQTRSYDQAVDTLEDILGIEHNAEMNAHYQWPHNWDLP
jgi:alpha-galactosidase